MKAVSAVLFAAITAAVVCAVSAPSEAASSKERFDSIMANLDTGGDILIVANMEGYVQSMVSNIVQIMSAIPASGADAVQLRTFLARLPAFMNRNGFYAVQGFGASVVPRADGLNTVKTFIARDRSAANAALWRTLVGGAPRELACTRFLPADTVIARTGTGELPQLWNLIRAGVAEFGTPAANAGFNSGMSNLSSNMGVNVDAVIESLGNEGFFSLQLSTTSSIEIPTGPKASMKMPSPSLLIGIAVKDDSLVRAIEQPLNRAKIPIQKTQIGAVSISSSISMPSPIPLQPSFAVCSNFFLLGSTPAVVSDAVAAFQSGNGLVAVSEYKKAFQDLPAANNGIFYMSPRFMRALSDVMAQVSDAPGQTASPALVQAVFGAKSDTQSAFVFRNNPDGILTIGVSSSGGRELAGAAVMAPLGILAGIAIPSFVKARSQSQMNACINNLRQIDAAKEQWALEMRKQNGDPVDATAMSQYIKGGKLPVCPQGGTYTVNPIGKNPQCSVPGHAMPLF